MPIIVSLLTQDKFDAASVAIPAGISIQFADLSSAQSIVNACENADCLFAPASAGKIGPSILENIPSIKIIQGMGVGFDHVDISASVRLGIPVANVPAANASSVAEQTIGLLIAMQRRMVESDAEIKNGNYMPFRNAVLCEGLQEVRGCEIGLLGFGNIGRAVARLAVALGASVSYFSPRRQSPEIEEQYSVTYKNLETLLATSDAISLHLPLNDQTKGLIGARELALMPQGSMLINTARGEIVNQAALCEALESGLLAGAALDTFAPEPPPADHPLFLLSATASKRLLLTPHTAGVTLGAYKRMIEGALENMARVMRGELPTNVVNGIYRRSQT